jgi:hypothetical protein
MSKNYRGIGFAIVAKRSTITDRMFTHNNEGSNDVQQGWFDILADYEHTIDFDISVDGLKFYVMVQDMNSVEERDESLKKCKNYFDNIQNNKFREIKDYYDGIFEFELEKYEIDA